MKKPARIGFGNVNLLVAALVGRGVFRGLPTRWWVVDNGALVVIVMMAASGLALLANHHLAERITRVAAFVVLGIGLALFATLAMTASWLYGVYGPVGKGGAMIFVLVALMVLPYLVIFPAVLLGWIGVARKREST